MNICNDGDPKSSLDSLCEGSVLLTVAVFPDVQTEPPVFQCVPTGSVLPGDTTEKTLAPSSLDPPSRHLPIEMRYPLSLLWAKLSSQPFAVEETHHHHLCVPSRDAVRCVHFSFALGSPVLGLSTPGVATPALSRAEETPPSTSEQHVVNTAPVIASGQNASKTFFLSLHQICYHSFLFFHSFPLECC